MSLVPEFELGLWNAYILVIPVLILSIVGWKILGKRASGGFSGYTEKEKTLESIGMIIIFAFYAYSIFLPLKLGTRWFYVGLLIYLLGMSIVVLAMLSFHITPADKPVTKGVYRISRHPMYVGDILISIGISTACLSWVYLLQVVVAAILYPRTATREEKACLNQFGDTYKDYMNTTPKWIGIPKSKNLTSSS